MSDKASRSAGYQRRARKKKTSTSGDAADCASPSAGNNPHRNQFFDSNIAGSSGSGKKYVRHDYGEKLQSSGKHGANVNEASYFLKGRYAGGKGSMAPASQLNLKRRQKQEKPTLRNGEKGAEAYTVSENDRIKFTELLIGFREKENMKELQLPTDLTNTERKFLHSLASQLGLKSKSSGKD